MSGINNTNYQNSFNRIINKSKSRINKIKINSTMFSEIIPNNQIIDLLSIDIEGNEFEVLNSIAYDIYEIKVIILTKFFTYVYNRSVFFAVTKFGDPPKTGSVILKGIGRVFSLYPKTGSITKKCKK